MDSKYIDIVTPNSNSPYSIDHRPYAILFIQPNKEPEKCLLRPVYGAEGICEAVDECIRDFPQLVGIQVLEHRNGKEYVGEHGFPGAFSKEQNEQFRKKMQENRIAREKNVDPGPKVEFIIEKSPRCRWNRWKKPLLNRIAGVGLVAIILAAAINAASRLGG